MSPLNEPFLYTDPGESEPFLSSGERLPSAFHAPQLGYESKKQRGKPPG
jgi:hypothetical protein